MIFTAALAPPLRLFPIYTPAIQSQINHSRNEVWGSRTGASRGPNSGKSLLLTCETWTHAAGFCPCTPKSGCRLVD